MDERLKLIEDKLKEYMAKSEDYCLKKAMVYETCYQYIDNECYTNHKDILTFDDMLDIADKLVCSYYLNEELCDMVQEYIDKQFKEREEEDYE